jgi:hypothetical protein
MYNPGMAVITNELMYDVLKSVQAQVAVIREDVTTIKARMTSVDQRLGIIHTDMALSSERMDRIESRLGRVENRLNLSDA